MPTAGLDFFRVDRSGATRKLLVSAALLVALGATAIGAHLVHKVSAELGRVVSLVGGITVVVGLILGFGAMAMLVFENVYLLIGREGVVCHDNGKETRIAWTDLGAVVLEDRSGFVVLEREGAEPLRWFAGATAADLHARLVDSKRKALHGLLPFRDQTSI